MTTRTRTPDDTVVRDSTSSSDGRTGRDGAEVLPGLSAVLDEVRASLGADTTTLLVLDSSRTSLEPAATVGLDRTLRRARRVPLGQGFAGRVAQTRQPVALTQVDSSTVINPVLLAHGVQSLLGVPVMDGSELVGVLHVGWRSPHDAGDEETLRLTEHADRIGEALADRFLDQANAAALTLQRSLLPTAVATPEGITIAARYVPADGELGGDWYDVFELPDGRLGLVMGDVVGHGLRAAVVMGRLRSALRAYALEHDDPAEVLTSLDRKINHFEPEVCATVLYAVAAAPYTSWHVSSAGHHPPLIGTSGSPAVVAAVPADRLLGVDPDAPRTCTVVDVPAGAFMCLYTDGLVERRPTGANDVITAMDRNTERLAAALGDAGDPELRCIRALSEVVGDHVAEDDIAILVAETDTPAGYGSSAPLSAASVSSTRR